MSWKRGLPIGIVSLAAATNTVIGASCKEQDPDKAAELKLVQVVFR